ncbi:hypothetical protein J6590_080120 [Homalodisca vitripennis]|nr:hypothetical protein J6590_065798 [Homalodisca vitripennis]KAG8295448.1 hypothetical protein J6590_080120 [Homalodisca vitripennis]
MMKTLREWKVEHWTTPIYHPQANPTERRNQELKKLLRTHLIDKEHKTWDQQLPQSLFAFHQQKGALPIKIYASDLRAVEKPFHSVSNMDDEEEDGESDEKSHNFLNTIFDQE